MNHDFYDVIVIGAGPSGSTAAYELSRMGVKTLLLDREVFPRRKPCGGLLSLKATKILNLSHSSPFIEAIPQKLAIYSRHYRKIIWEDDMPLGYTVKRENLDAYLVERAQRAGAFFIDREKVLDIEEEGNYQKIVTAKNSYYGEFLIGADGTFSTTAYKMGLRPHFFHSKLGITFSTVVEDPALKIDNTLELYFIPFLGGFGWCFPLQNGYNIGVGSSIFGKRALLHYFHSFYYHIQRLKESRFPPFRPIGAFLPAGGFKRPLGKRKLLLVGDAAGTADPFSGEGIHNAVHSAKLAAQSIYKSLLGEGDALALYRKQINQYLLPDLRYSLVLSILSGRKNELQFDMLTHNPDMLQWITNIMKRSNCYGDLFLQNTLRLPHYTLRMLLQR